MEKFAAEVYFYQVKNSVKNLAEKLFREILKNQVPTFVENQRIES